MKFFANVLVGVIGILITLVLLEPLIGVSNAPWLNFYFLMVLVWGTVALIWLCALNQTVAASVGAFVGDWVYGGGFWAVWSKSNIPGNTWVVLALILFTNAITYGPPSPTVSWDSIKEVVNQPSTQGIISSAQGAVNYLSTGFIGIDLFQTKPLEPTLLLEVYQLGWWRIWAALFAVLFAPLVCIWGRRDELHEKFSNFADRFREKRETSGSATSGSSSSGVASDLIKKVIGQTDEGSQITNHVIGEFLTRAVETVFGSLAKLMKKY